MKQRNFSGSLQRRLPWLAPSAITALGLLLYAHTLNAPFLFDDLHAIVQNAKIRTLGDPLGMFAYGATRTLTFFTFALNYSLHEYRVFGYHVVNLGIHLGNGLLVYWLALVIFRTPVMTARRKTLEARWIALLASLLFVAHPLQVGAVTYIVQRLESLAAGLYLLSVALYLEARLRRRERRSWSGWYAASLIAGLFGVFAKETIVTLPAAIVLIEVCMFSGVRRTPPETAGERIKLVAPYLAVAVCVPLVLLFASPSSGSLGADLANLSLGEQRQSRTEYLLTQFRVIVAYLRLTVLPTWQSLDPQVRTSHTLLEGTTLGSLTILLALLAAAVRGARRWPLPAFGLLWIFITLAPSSSIRPIYDPMFEHRMYLPFAGAALSLAAMAASVRRLASNRGRAETAAVASVMVIVLCLGLLTVRRNWTWGNGQRLWSDAVRKSPMKARPHVNLGMMYYEGAAYDRAMLLFLRALRADPSYHEAWNNAVAWNNVGYIRLLNGRHDSALVALARALRLDPMYALAHNNRGVAYQRRGRLRQAVHSYRRAAAAQPGFARPYHNLGVVLSGRRQLHKALAAFRHAQYLAPRSPDTAYVTADALYRLGLSERSLRAYRYVLRLQPDNTKVRQNVRFLEQQLRRRR